MGGRGKKPAHRQPIAQAPKRKGRPTRRLHQTHAQSGEKAKAEARQHSEQQNGRCRIHQIFPKTRSSQPAKPVALMSNSGAKGLASSASFLRGGR